MSRSKSSASKTTRGARLALLLSALLASVTMLATFACSASALSFGMGWTGDPGEAAAEMEQVQHSGATLFRVPIDLTTSSNGNDWSTYDLIFENAWKHGVTIEPILDRSNSSGTQFPTEGEYAGWDGWVEKVVKRYGPGGEFWAGKANQIPATTWEVWNEPNLVENNPGGAKVQPENYGRFLVSTSGAIHKVQAGATVLIGGLYMPGGEYYNSFLEAASKVSGEPTSYSGVAIHPYAFFGKVTEMNEEIASVRLALNSHVSGGASKSLWITELGWPVIKGDAQHPAVSEAEQASLVTSSLNSIKGLAASDNIQSVVWYNLRDIPFAGWSYGSGLRKENGEYRPAWRAFQEETGAPEWPKPLKHYADELGFVAFKTAPKNTHIDTYSAGPTYTSLLDSSDTGYPSVSEPKKLQALAIDTNGDGIDELGFLALTNPGNVHLDTYTGAPDYKTLSSDCNTGYPSVPESSLSKVQALAIDTNGDGVDELGFLSLTSPGNVHLDVYGNPPCYNTLISDSNTGYPSIPDPSKVKAIAIDTNGDGIDELGFLSLTNPGNVHLDTYTGAPTYKTLASDCNTGYPSIAESALKYVQPMALDWNGDGTDELGFATLKTSSGSTHLDTYTDGPCYNVLASNSDTAYPGVTNIENVQALALNVNTTGYTPPPPPPASTWHFASLGSDTILEDPAISSSRPGYLDVFAKGLDGNLWQKWTVDGAATWSSWANISAVVGGQIASGPASVSWGPGRVDIVARMKDNSIGHWYNDGTWHFDNLGGPTSGAIAGDPEIASPGSGKLNVFARGTDGSLWQKVTTNGGATWSSWQNISTITGGSISSSPGAVSASANTLTVVARKPASNVGVWSWSGSAWSYQELSGQILGDPDISSTGGTSVNVFAKGLDNNLWQQWTTGTGWSEWQNLSAFGGGQIASSPGAVSWGWGRVDTVARMPGGTVGHWWYGP